MGPAGSRDEDRDCADTYTFPNSFHGTGPEIRFALNLGARIMTKAYAAKGLDPAVITTRTASWLGHGARLGLGTDDPASMDVVEIRLR